MKGKINIVEKAVLDYFSIIFFFEIDPFCVNFRRHRTAETYFAKSHLRQFNSSEKVFLSLPYLFKGLPAFASKWTVECVETPMMFSFNYRSFSSFVRSFSNLSRSELPNRIGSLTARKKLNKLEAENKDRRRCFIEMLSEWKAKQHRILF